MNFIKKTFLKWQYKKGKFISKFIAHDIRKDIIVEDDSEIDLGFVIVKDRIFDARMVKKTETEIPQFSSPKKVEIKELWNRPFSDLCKEN